jgi:D-threo-aldose 1-dehydrogenase
VSLRAAALQFPFTHASVATVCVGCRNPDEVRQNAEDLSVEIPVALWHDLGESRLVRTVDSRH